MESVQLEDSLGVGHGPELFYETDVRDDAARHYARNSKHVQPKAEKARKLAYQSRLLVTAYASKMAPTATSTLKSVAFQNALAVLSVPNSR